jgi:DnaK suppressor protein
MSNLNERNDDEFRQLILARLAEMQAGNALGHQGQQTVTLDQQSVGRLSRMDALQNQAMAKAAQRRRDVEARRLTDALARLDEGEFGYCDDCGDEIALGRLRLDPAATRCVSCIKG